MFLETLAGELRIAARTLLRAPVFTLAAVLSLAMGIGVSTAVFGLADAIVLRKLAVPQPDRLVSVYNRAARGTGLLSSNSLPDYEYYRDNSKTLAGVLAYVKFPLTLRAGGAAEQTWTEMVTPNYFELLRLAPAMGRGFHRDDENVVILSHGLWVRRFGADSGILGKPLKLNGRVFTIVGVAPAGFRGIVVDWGRPPELWAPLASAGIVGEIPVANRGMHWLLVTGRLRDGARLSDARAEIDTFSAQLAQAYPKTNGEFRARVYPLQEARFWPGSRDSVLGYLEVLGAIAALMLLIACTNVASLLLSRAARRRRELGIRVAIGAGRLSLARGMLVECLLLTTAGAALGLVLAATTSSVLQHFNNPFGIPLNVDLGLNGRVLACAALLAVVTAIPIALSPLRVGSRLDVQALLKDSAGRRRFRLSEGLVVAQFAICLVALAGAGLFLRTLEEARESDPAFKMGNGLLVGLDPGDRYDEPRLRSFYANLLDRVSSQPGVLSAAYVRQVAMSGTRGAADITVKGQTRNVNVNTVSAEYFTTAGIPVVAGRGFERTDRAGAPAVAVINELMARAIWPDQPPLGQRFRLRNGKEDIEVAGVVRDGRMRNFREDPRPCFYLPFEQNFTAHGITLQIRTGPDPLLVLAAVRREIQELDREMPLDFRTIRQHLDASLSRERMLATLLTLVGVIATVLAAVGLYGVMATAVAQRSREMGIRMALGAEPRGIVGLVMKRSALLAAAGLTAGIAGSAALARLIETLLYGVKPGDPAVLSLACVLLAGVAVAAAWIPAARAARVDPAGVLRQE